MSDKKIDFLAIGDTVIDAFIKLRKADIIGKPDTPDYKIAMIGQRLGNQYIVLDIAITVVVITNISPFVMLC